MELTIKTRLLGLTISGLVFVAGVSVTGYWGITSVHKTDRRGGRNANRFSHSATTLKRESTTTSPGHGHVCGVHSKKGDEQQEQSRRICHSTASWLPPGIALPEARDFATDPASQSMLEYRERNMSSQYVSAGDALISAIIHNPSTAPGLLGPYLVTLQRPPRKKSRETSDQLAEECARCRRVEARLKKRRVQPTPCSWDVRNIAFCCYWSLATSVRPQHLPREWTGKS